jgi:hypothetical protein
VQHAFSKRTATIAAQCEQQKPIKSSSLALCLVVPADAMRAREKQQSTFLLQFCEGYCHGIASTFVVAS